MADDCVGAVREVAKVYELIKNHQPLFLLHHHPHQGQHEPPAMTTQMAQHLLSEALRALNIALSAMTMMQKQQEVPTASSPLPVKPEPAHQLSSSSPTTSTSARSSKRKRSSTVTDGKSSSWTISTTVPYEVEVGYEWRKYGEKRINGTHFTRSYFRCTHKEHTGCLATKYVQQKDNTDPPMFQVTYNNEHTCNCTATSSSSTPNYNIRLPITGGATISRNHPPTDHLGVILKQEQTVVVPPPLTVNVPLDDDHQMPCQEPLLPITTDHNVATGDQLAGDSLCIPGVSCNNDELDMGWTMTEPLMGDDDPELQVLYNSFKYLL